MDQVLAIQKVREKIQTALQQKHCLDIRPTPAEYFLLRNKQQLR